MKPKRKPINQFSFVSRETNLSPMKTINWKVFFILWIAATLSIIAILPYSLSLQSTTLQKLKLPMPLSVLLVIQVLQNAILFAIAIFGGLFFAKRVRLTTPILDAVAQREVVADKVRAILPLSIAIGLI